MAENITLNPVATFQNDSSAVATTNANYTTITNAFTDVLSRSGTSPNTMQANLDMNGFRILNLPMPTNPTDPVRAEDIGTASAASAAASAAAAAASASSASTSASTATSEATIATNAANSIPTSPYFFSTSTVSGDPGSGFFRLNNATISSATALFISKTDSSNNAIGPYIATFGSSNSANKSVLKLSSAVAPLTNYAQFYITSAATDNGTWDSFTISFINQTGGGFLNNSAMVVGDTRVGDQGTAGSGTISGGVAHAVALTSSASAVTTVATVGTAGRLLIDQGASADPSFNAMSGDATITSTGAITVSKTGGTSFATSATTDATNASNISSGTLAAARGGAGAVSGVLKANGSGTVSAAVVGTDFISPSATANITAGYTFTAASLGTLSSFTLNPALGNYQFGTINSSITITAPATDCAVDVLITNGATAAVPTFSGFTVGSNTGDAYTTTNTNKFILSVRRINGTSTYVWKALQ